MLALRLVVSTNILVSAALTPRGLQRTTFLLAVTRPARLYLSLPILREYVTVLSRPELKIPRSERFRLLQLLKTRGFLIAPRRHLEVTSDPDDNMFVECAEAARADYLITGNQKHFPRFWKQTKVITSREFVEIAAPHLLLR